MQEEQKQSRNVDAENRVGEGMSTVPDSAQLPHGGSSGSKSGNTSVGIGGIHRETMDVAQQPPQPAVDRPVEKVEEKLAMRTGGLTDNKQQAVDPSSSKSP